MIPFCIRDALKEARRVNSWKAKLGVSSHLQARLAVDVAYRLPYREGEIQAEIQELMYGLAEVDSPEGA